MVSRDQVFSLFLLWGTIVLAVILWAAAIVCVAIYAREQRGRFLSVACICLVGGIISAVANPLVNLIAFHEMDRRASEKLFSRMEASEIVGHTTEELLREFGCPRRKVESGSGVTWIYSGSPWFIAMWTEVYVAIESNRVSGIGISLD